MHSQARLRGVLGRQRELADLERAWATVRGGRPVDVVVEGPPGIGKTALAEDFLSQHDEIRQCRISGLRWERDLPFGVMEQLFTSFGDSAPSSPSRSGQSPSPAPAPSPSPDRSAVDVARRLLALWSGSEQPVIVLIDDSHWADVVSLQAISSALRRMPSGRVMVIMNVREQEQVPADIQDVLAHHNGPVMRLGPLKAADVQALAIHWTGVDLSPPAARRLAEHTLGNPLHIKQLLHDFATETWSRWQPMLPAPRAFTATMRERLDRCGPDARALVEAAAVLGETAPFADAARLADIDEPVVSLDEAHHAGLLLPTVNDQGLEFASPLERAAVYTDLSPLRRHQLHQRAADIVDGVGDRLTHRVSVTPFADAALADELDAFAVQQASLGAWSTVGKALIDASRLSPAKADREQRLIRAVDALVGAGDLPQAIAYSPAIESVAPSALRDAVLGYLAILLGRPAEAESLLAQAWHRCDPRLDPDTAALICQRRVLHSMSRWNGPELVSWARRAIELVTPEAPAAVESEAIIGLGLAASGQIEQARAAYRENSTKAEAGAQAQRFQMGKGWLDLALDDPLTAHRELESAAPTQYRMGSARISLWAQAWLARTEFALGSWDDAIHTVNRAVSQLDSVGLDLVRPLVHWTGAQTQALRGNWDAAHEHLQQGSAGGHNYEIMLVPACLARAQCAEITADYNTVVRALEPLALLQPRKGIDEPGFWPWHDVYANALVMTYRVEEADAFLAPHEKVAAERGHRSAMARLGYVRGRIAASTGDIDSARAAFDRALDKIAGLPLPYERARVNFAYGQTLRRAGKRREADVVLQNARDGYAALGAMTYVERCDRELKASGLHAKRAPADITELTAQERAVAALVAAGNSNKQAAAELFISVKTVQFHLTRVYAKLGINSRGELAARFHDSP